MQDDAESFLGIKSEAQQGEQTLLSTQAEQKPSVVPVVVRVYGMIIMVLQIIGIVLYSIGTIIALVHTVSSNQPYLRGGILIAGAWIIVIQIILFRLGKGLRAGERQAVYGLSILGGLALLIGIGCLIAGYQIEGFAFLFTVVILYVPPIVSAFRHWTLFK